MSILLAGGAGYIGSHTAVELIKAGYDVIIVDNYDNSCPEVINRIERITGTRPIAYEADVRDTEAMRQVFSENEIDVVIHFAGLKAVGESVDKPIKYYRNNIDTTLTLIEVMEEFGCKNIVFSSSATVYGEDAPVPYIESMGRGKCTNPYGWTKNMMEQILEDAAYADSEMSVVLLRYFNPIGADSSGLIGEDPQGIPNNLMPYVAQVAIGRRDKLTIFGNDYPTPDGTCRRDFIHVTDLALGHVKAVEYVKSINCMMEMSYLFGQADWDMKAMVLVIDDSLYSIERKLEVLTYWNLFQQKSANRITDEALGNELLSQQKEFIDQICEQLEGFLKGISRRKNPSQIAIVSEIIKKAQNRDKEAAEKIITNGEETVLGFLEERGPLTLQQLSKSTNFSEVAVRRYIQNLISAGKLERVGSKRTCYYKVNEG